MHQADQGLQQTLLWRVVQLLLRVLLLLLVLMRGQLWL
jgi:hypothetical protein